MSDRISCLNNTSITKKLLRASKCQPPNIFRQEQFLFYCMQRTFQLIMDNVLTVTRLCQLRLMQPVCVWETLVEKSKQMSTTEHKETLKPTENDCGKTLLYLLHDIECHFPRNMYFTVSANHGFKVIILWYTLYYSSYIIWKRI